MRNVLAVLGGLASKATLVEADTATLGTVTESLGINLHVEDLTGDAD